VRLTEAAPNRLYRMILVLLYATGARRTEAARIKVEDIDGKRMVRICRTNWHPAPVQLVVDRVRDPLPRAKIHKLCDPSHSA
jgi:integrase